MLETFTWTPIPLDMELSILVSVQPQDGGGAKLIYKSIKESCERVEIGL